MGTFAEHVDHSRKNLEFLSSISSDVNNCWDWQVTVCFYTALHLINAHIVNKTQNNYLSHSKVDEIINPFNQMSLARLDNDTYTSYTKLFHLSRRSRYLLNENYKKEHSIQAASFTYSKHLKKAIHHLDIVINFIRNNYNEIFIPSNIKCMDLQGLTFKNFTITT